VGHSRKWTVAAAAALCVFGFSFGSTTTGRALAAQLQNVFVTGGTVGIDPASNAVTVAGPVQVQPAPGARFPVSGTVAVDPATTVNTTVQGVNISTQLLFDEVLSPGESFTIDTSQFKEITVVGHQGTNFSGSILVGIPESSGSGFLAEFEPVNVGSGAGARRYDICTLQVKGVLSSVSVVHVRVFGRVD
jgi:hypothetical protein